MKKVFLVLAVLSVCATARAVELRQTVWGFDGRVVLGRFNQLSLLIENPTQKPFDDVVTLRKTAGAMRPIGEDFSQLCFLSPGAQRWVQFYPHIAEADEQWQIVLGHGLSLPATLPAFKAGPPGRVMLADPSEISAGAGVKRMAEDLFPVSVAATDGLGSVVLDHAPRWEPARQEAFMDWLRCGGTLHLLHDVAGRYPHFSDALDPLNSDVDEYRIGAGLVAHHPIERAQATDDYFASRGYPLPSEDAAQRTTVLDPLDGLLLSGLSNLSRPHHNWMLIFTLVCAYVLAAGPVNYLIARKRRNYWIAIGFFAATVVLFSLGFNYVGSRTGETTAIRTLSHVRPLGNGNYDVTQWCNLFVARGGEYAISHGSARNFYSTCQRFEAVNGVVDTSPPGVFAINMPIFSSRQFKHRAKMKGDPLELDVTSWFAHGPTDLVIEGKPALPQGIDRAVAVFGDDVYTLTIAGNTLRASAAPLSVERYCGNPDQYRHALERVRAPYGERASPAPSDAREQAGEMFRNMLPLLMADELGVMWSPVPGAPSAPRPERPKDRLRVVLLAQSPRSFALHSDPALRNSAEIGCTIYDYELFKPEK